MDRIDVKTTENQLRQEFIQGYVPTKNSRSFSEYQIS